MPPSSTSRAAAAALALLALAGCGPKFEFAEVEGKVTLDEKPLAGVLVRFYPVTDGLEQLPYASALSGPDGRYHLARQDGQPGALVGPNRVVVYWPSRDMRAAAQVSGAPFVPPEPPVPLLYTVASLTPLTMDVRPGGRQTIDLKLDTKLGTPKGEN